MSVTKHLCQTCGIRAAGDAGNPVLFRMLARRACYPAALPPLRVAGELLHLGIVRPLPSPRARPRIAGVGIAGETAASARHGDLVPGLRRVGRHRQVRVDLRGLPVLAGEIRPPARCPTCGRGVPLGPAGSCRLCHKQRHLAARLLGRPIATVSLAEASAHGQQLFIAGTWRPAGTPRREYQKKTVPADMTLLRPAAHRQLVLLDVPRDLRLGMRGSFPPPPDPALAAAFFEFIRDHAARYGWLKTKTALTQRSVRIMLGIQDTPGAPVRRSDVMLLTQIRHPAAAVAEVLAAAGMLEEDRQPPVVRWFDVTVAGLPAPMRHELGTWLEIMRNGRIAPPRLKPRSDQHCPQPAGLRPARP